MAIRKVINKLTHTKAIIKIVNDADAADTITITLNTDLLKDNESLDGATPKVSVKYVEWSVADQTGYVLVKRNNVVVYRLHSTNLLNEAFNLDHDGNTYDLEFTMTGGTIIMELDKIQGYLPDFQPEQHGGE